MVNGLLTAWIWFGLLLAAPLVQAEEQGPTEQLKPAIDNLIEILGDADLQGEASKSERREKIMAAISGGFDFREMSRRVLGRTWNRIDAQEQDYFVVQMTKLLENVYIGRLETYSGEAVEFVGERIKGKRAQVTTIIEQDSVKIPVHYIMQKEHDRWMVYDINIEGVSLIRNYMEQFRSILRTEKYEGLIKIIEEKNLSFAEGTES
jgi:phospholipid transport system substrate-binding protein